MNEGKREASKMVHYEFKAREFIDTLIGAGAKAFSISESKELKLANDDNFDPVKYTDLKSENAMYEMSKYLMLNNAELTFKEGTKDVDKVTIGAGKNKKDIY